MPNPLLMAHFRLYVQVLQQLTKTKQYSKAVSTLGSYRKCKQLAQLEMLVNPTVETLMADDSMANAGTLEITFRRGRMIVELPASVLFDSGSADLSDEGKKAVVEVARVRCLLRSALSSELWFSQCTYF